MKPVRLQLSRKKGFKLTSPNGLPIAVVSRPSKWGNPHVLKEYKFASISPGLYDSLRRAMATRDFEMSLVIGLLGFTEADVRRELRGKNLACWCPPRGNGDENCHADVLLRIANG